MPLLHLLRHAKAARDDPGLDDHERPLAKRGRKDAPAMAAAMAEEGIRPDLVLVSTARRTRETWAAMAAAFDPRTEAAFEAGLYLAPAEDLFDRLRRLDDGRREVLLIGHNPGLQDLALRLAAPGDKAIAGLAEKFPTAALASLDLGPTGWRRLRPAGARLVRFLRPADLAGR